MDLQQLIERVKQQDQLAFEELFNYYYPSGFSLALQFVKNQDDALDIMQDVFITVYGKLDQLDNPAKFKSWYMQIVANKCRDFLKKQNPLSFTDANAYDEEGALQFEIEETHRDFIPEEAADYSETVRIVDDMIAQLPEEQRMCVLLYFANDMTIPEIAKALEVSEATVKSRLKYAKDKIRSKVDDYEKKNGIRLHSIAGLAFIPFIRWALSQQSAAMPQDAAGVFAGISQAVTGGASTAASAGTSTGILGRLASLTSTQKVLSGITAGAIVLCAAAGVGTTLLSKGHKDTPTDSSFQQQSQTSKTQLDWNTYITVEFLGIQGWGTASVQVDYTSLDALLGQEKLQAFFGKGTTPSAASLLTFTLSQKENLKNGDTVTLTVTPPSGKTLEDVMEYFAITFAPTLELTVEGLAEVEEVDILSILTEHLTYTGGNGNAYAEFRFPTGYICNISDRVCLEFEDVFITVKADGKAVGTMVLLAVAENADVEGDGNLEIMFDENGPLSNGDTLTVHLLTDDLETMQTTLRPLGYSIESLRYELTVSGL